MMAMTHHHLIKCLYAVVSFIGNCNTVNNSDQVILNKIVWLKNLIKKSSQNLKKYSQTLVKEIDNGNRSLITLRLNGRKEVFKKIRLHFNSSGCGKQAIKFTKIIKLFKNNLEESFSLVNAYYESSDNLPDTLGKVFLQKV